MLLVIIFCWLIRKSSTNPVDRKFATGMRDFQKLVSIKNERFSLQLNSFKSAIDPIPDPP